MKKSLAIIVLSLLALLGCTNDNSSSAENIRDISSTDLFSVDSISDCIIEESVLEDLIEMDSIHIFEKNLKQSFHFPTYINDSKEKYHAETRKNGDTLIFSMVKKDDGVETALFCPVRVYVTLNENLNEKYIATKMGVYRVVLHHQCVVLDPVYMEVSSSSSSEPLSSSSLHNSDSIQTLEAFLEEYDITDYSFDKNVLAYNETSGYCDALQNTCFEAPGISEFRTLGLHRFEANDITALTTIFPHAAAAMNNKIEGCPLYVLNISDTSPAIHILTNITKDTVTIVNISDECAYDPRPFDMNVGFLFTYCDELSENPEVVTTQVFDDKMECGTIEYAEYISERL